MDRMTWSKLNFWHDAALALIKARAKT